MRGQNHASIFYIVENCIELPLISLFFFTLNIKSVRNAIFLNVILITTFDGS